MIALKEMKKIITYFNKIFTKKEIETSFIHIYSDENLEIIFRNENDVFMGKSIPLLGELKFNPISIKLSDLYAVINAKTKGQVVTFEINSDTKVLVIMVDDRAIGGLDYYDSNSSYFFKIKKEYSDVLSKEHLVQTVTTLNNILKTNCFKELDLPINNKVFFELYENNCTCYATNGQSIAKRILKITNEHKLSIMGIIDFSDIVLIKKWFDSCVDNTIKVSLNSTESCIIFSVPNHFISVYYQITDNKLIGIFKGMTKTICDDSKINSIALSDFSNKIDKEELKAGRVLVLNNNFKGAIFDLLSIDTPNINPNYYIYDAQQIKNLIFVVEEVDISIGKNHYNPLIMNFKSDNGCCIINGYHKD